METPPKLSRRLLAKAFWLWQFFSHSTYNYKTMQGGAFGLSMLSIFRSLYAGKQAQGENAARHTGFFNTEPCFGLLIHGSVIAREEQKARGEAVSDHAIAQFKTKLMGLLAGFGDAITQGMMVPVGLSIALSLALQGVLWTPVAYVVLISVLFVGLGYAMWMLGYYKGQEAITKLLSHGRATRMVYAAQALGVLVLGGLLWECVLVPVASGPGLGLLLPHFGALAVVGLLFLGLKKWRANTLIYLLLCLGAALSLLGVLTPSLATTQAYPIAFWQCILLGVCYYAAHGSVSAGMAFVTLYRPLWSGFLAGLILGDVSLGAQMGALLQLVYLSFLGVGGTMPADLALGGLLGIALSLCIGLPLPASLVPCFLLGRLGSLLWPYRMKYNQRFAAKASEAIAKGDRKTAFRFQVWAPQGTLMAVMILPFALLLWALCLLCPAAAAWPGWLLSALAGGGCLLPCMGIAANLRMLMAHRTWPLFAVGIGLSVLGAPVWCIALVSLPMAVFVFKSSASPSLS